jgi:RNA polymerase sigma-70 factor (ECF subfamily)
MANVNDRILVDRILSGDKKAFEELLDAHETSVYRLALRYAETIADAEDLTQEVFLGIYQSIASFQGRSALSTWVYRIALNHCLEYRRKRRIQSVPIEEKLMLRNDDWQADPEEATFRTDLAHHVQEALNCLTPAHKEVVVLHELQGMTYQEVAATLDVPVGTVKSRLSNAFRKLRDQLGSYVYEGKTNG